MPPANPDAYQESAEHAQQRLNSKRWQNQVYSNKLSPETQENNSFDLESIAGGDRSLMRELRGAGAKIHDVNAGAIHQVRI